MAITLDGTNGINSSGVIVAPDGSASAPSITNDGDTNTGIYFPAADNIGFATNGVIRGRWTTDGLCFGSDTAAANALDDYEEGTFTATITGSTTAGTATYSTQQARYTKIGNRVLVTIFLTYNSGTGTGNLRISGLPFAANGEMPLANYNANIAMSAGHVMQTITSGVGQTTITINSVPSGGGTDVNVAYDAAGLIMVCGNYDVA